MHYRGFVIVDEPTEEAVDKVMRLHGGEDAGEKWDWYRCGGREDGYLISDAEMMARNTHHGFNFDETNNSAERNSCQVSELPADRRQIYFFAVDWSWVSRETYVEGYLAGGSRFEPNAEFKKQFDQALADHPNSWVVVVDAHN
jgi:hypothetical protein